MSLTTIDPPGCTGERRRASPEEIRRDLRNCFWIAFAATAVLAVVIWWTRISQFSQVLTAYKISSETAFTRIVFGANGIVSLGLTAGSMGIMALFWWGFRNHLLAQNDPEFRRQHSFQRLRVLEEMHDPPGDIFTLIGIAFTFAGLTFSMACIPADLVAGIMAPDESLTPVDASAIDETALKLVAAAIVFGSSLAVGLLASLNGVMLSVFARQASAKYEQFVSSSSDLSRHISHLPEIAAGMGVLSNAATGLRSSFISVSKDDWTGSAKQNHDELKQGLDSLARGIALIVEALREATVQPKRRTPPKPAKPKPQNGGDPPSDKH